MNIDPNDKAPRADETEPRERLTIDPGDLAEIVKGGARNCCNFKCRTHCAGSCTGCICEPEAP